jgi:hypothetical protein
VKNEQDWIGLLESVMLSLDLSCSTLVLPGKIDHSISQLIKSYCCPTIKWSKHLTCSRVPREPNQSVNRLDAGRLAPSAPTRGWWVYVSAARPAWQVIARAPCWRILRSTAWSSGAELDLLIALLQPAQILLLLAG